MTSRDINKKRVIEALHKTLGIESHACKLAGISRESYYKWKRNDPAFAKEVDSVADMALDFAESMLFKKIRDGDTTAMIFYLKTKGKKRGYIERQELAADLTGKQSVTVKIVRGNITPS